MRGHVTANTICEDQIPINSSDSACLDAFRSNSAEGRQGPQRRGRSPLRRLDRYRISVGGTTSSISRC
jgi:hypothetical protein